MIDPFAADPIEGENMYRAVRWLFSLAAIVAIFGAGCGSSSSPERKVRTIVVPKGAKSRSAKKSWKFSKPVTLTP